jgi:FMN phosphatase YigB (HAD superfamily)
MLNDPRLVFLLDFDNTLFDNDRFTSDLERRLTQDFGCVASERFWELYAQRRASLGYADYLGTLEAFRSVVEDDPRLLLMSEFLLDYPFADHLYPKVGATLAHLHRLGLCVVLSDGDVVFQPRKVQRSGMSEAVGGRVLIHLHKELALSMMERRYPADLYVAIDDKPNLLAAMKQVLGERLTTIFVRQGHYAQAAEGEPTKPAPDLTIDRISELLELDPRSFLSK